MALERPEIDPPEGDPPAELEVTDLVVGDGPEAAPGQTVSVHYAGVAFSTGEEFDASWNRGQEFRFGLGQGQVIAGWDQGVTGHEGRRPPPPRHPAAPRLRRPRGGRRDRARARP